MVKASSRIAVWIAMIFCALGIFVSRAAAQEETVAETPIAIIGKIVGKVRVQPYGKASWRPAVEGQDVFDGDSIRSGSGASVIIEFPGLGYVRLLPLGEASVTSAFSQGGESASVLMMDQGSAWARFDIKEEKKQFVVMTSNAVFNGRQASTFVESLKFNKCSCIDLFQGNMAARSREDQDSVVYLSPGQRINTAPAASTQTGSGGFFAPVQSLDADYNDSNAGYSCLTESEKTENAASEEKADKEQADSVNATTGMPGAVSETEEEGKETFISSTSPAIAFSPQAGGATTPAQGEQPTTTPAPEIEETLPDGAVMVFNSGAEESSGTEEAVAEVVEEYEEIEIVGVAFVTVEAAPVVAENSECSAQPVISDVFIAGRAASAGEALEIKSSSKCGPVAKPVITWNASISCGSVISMAVSSGGAEAKFALAQGIQSAPGKHTFEVTDSNAREIVIKAFGSNGQESRYTFSMSVPEPKEVPLPRITELFVNTMPVKNGQVLSITSDLCETAQFYIEGKAASECGDISMVSVSAREMPITVYGNAEWNSTILITESQTVSVKVQARDATGARSTPVSFSIDFTKSIEPPQVTIDVVGGTPVSSSFGEPIDVYRNDLVGGKLVVAGGAGSALCQVRKTEVSLGSGSTWNKAEGKNAWTYGFIPRDGDYQIMARAYDESGTLSEEMFQPVELTYYSKTREEILLEAFDRIMRAYQDRDADTIITNTAATFSTSYDSIEDRGRMDNALNGKFVDLSVTYLRYRMQTVNVSGKSGRVTFQWDANPSTSGYSKTGTFAFQKERDGWKLLTVEDNKTFLRYTSIADSMTISSAASRVFADGVDSTTITARILDSAENAVKDGTPVQFSAQMGVVDTLVTTRDGEAIATYTAGLAIGNDTITATTSGISASVTIRVIREFAPPPPGP